MKSSDLGKKVIRKELALIPKSPGVYRMLNHKGDILYVGKAKNLPNRLKNYVSEKNHIIRTERMLSQTFKIEITTTANESEALLLEANLIKKFKPKFNILLKDDKSFPFIFIGNKDQWPQVTKHRGKKDKDGFYFGPFASAGSANWTVKMLQKIFLLRVCDETTFKNRKRPCILYQIKRCSAPCVGYVEKKEYKNSVEATIRTTKGTNFDYFSKEAKNKFFNEEYQVTNLSDRMGMRLEGPKLENIVNTNIKSEGLVKGVVQVPADGNPIIMFSDHGSIGGYPKIAVVITADHDKAAQLAPGSRIKFKEVNLDEAESLFKTYSKDTKSYLEKIK